MDPVKQLKVLMFQMARNKLPIPPNDSLWVAFWTHGASMTDLIDSLSNNDIKYIRDENTINFINLISILASKIVSLASIRGLKLLDWPKNELLASIRLLTRLLPFAFEINGHDDLITNHFNSIFWSLDAFNLGSSNTFLHSMLVQSGGLSSSSLTDDSLKVKFNHLLFKDIPLGASLVKSLINLLFTLGFTVFDNTPSPDIWANDTQLILWEPGISESICYSKSNISCDSNRLEVLRLILLLCSEQMYTHMDSSIDAGSKFLTVLTTSIDKNLFACFNGSLINLICKSTKDNDANNPNINGLDFDDQIHKNLRLAMVTNSIQLFSIMISYSLPASDKLWAQTLNINESSRSKNLTRLICAKIVKSNELELIVKNLIHPLLKPLISQNQSMFSLTSNSYHIWSMELLTIILEFYQCNPRFRFMLASLVNTRIYFMLLFHIMKLKNDDRYINFIRLCSNFLLLLTTEKINSNGLLKEIDFKYYNLMPTSFKLDFNDTVLTNRDFLVIQICKFLMNDDYYPPVLSEPLIHILYNLIPIQTVLNKGDETILSMRKLSIKDNFIRGPTSQISLQASISIVQLINKLISKPNLYETNEDNLNLISLLLKSICQTVSKSPYDSIILIYSISKNYQVFQKVQYTVKKISDQLLIDKLNLEKCQDVNKNNNSEYDFQNKLEIPLPIPRTKSQSSLITTNNNNNTPLSSPVINQNDHLPPLSRQSTLDSRKSDYEEKSSSRQSFDLSKTESMIYQNDDIHLFVPYLPIGMSENAINKRLKDDALEDKWNGRTSIRIILKLIKLVNEEFRFNSTHSEIAISIHRMNKFDIQRITKLVPIENESFTLIRLHWSKKSIGWELSNLWGLIFLNYSIYSTKSIFQDISSSIKRATSSSFWGSFSWNKITTTSTNSTSISSPTEPSNDFDDFSGNLISTSIWLGTNIKMFKINPRILKDHYNAPTPPPVHHHSNGGSGPSSVEGFWRRQSLIRQNSSDSLRRKGRDSLDNGLRYPR